MGNLLQEKYEAQFGEIGTNEDEVTITGTTNKNEIKVRYQRSEDGQFQEETMTLMPGD